MTLSRDYRFEKLQKDIQEEILKPSYPKNANFENGAYVLARFKEAEEYFRVRIIREVDEDFQCLFVDLAEVEYVEKSDIKFLSNEFITRLPFQAIECKLHGIVPPEDCWSTETIDILYDLLNNPNSEDCNQVFAKVVATEPASTTNGMLHSVLLAEYVDGQFNVINKYLIDEGLAVVEEGVDVDFEFTLPDSTREGNSSEGEELPPKDFVKEWTENCCAMPQLEGFNFDEADFYGDVRTMETIAEQENRKVTISRDTPRREEEAITVQPFKSKSYFTPTVIWSEDETNIRLRVNLPGVEKFDFKILRNKIFTFRFAFSDQLAYESIPLHNLLLFREIINFY